MTHIYYDLPAPLRGSALESHGNWPVTWDAPDVQAALDVSLALTDTLNAGGVRHRYELMTVTDDHGTRVILNRKT